jgi:hypothetical protein
MERRRTRPRVAHLVLVRPRRVKPTPAQIILAYLGLALLLLGVFHKPVGLSDASGDTLVFVGIGCNLLTLFLYRRRKARLGVAAPLSTLSPAQRKAIFWLMLMLIAIISLSMPFWSPYTGVVLPFSTSVVVAIVSCVLAIALFIVGWKRGQRKV